MTSSNARKAIIARLASIQWLIVIAIILTSYGWLHYDDTAVWEMPFLLKSLSLPLALALAVGAFPAMAPYNPEDSEDFWQVASLTFKLFLMVHAIVLVLFRLNSV